jgi:uncharacterized protein (TIGR00251 family)
MKRYRIRVIPRASRNQVILSDSGELKVKLTAPPVDGKANEALLEVLADHFKIRKSSLKIHSGATSRNKIIEIEEESPSPLTGGSRPDKQGRK